MRVWQAATGRRGRDYSKLFFEHDLMIIGPGDLGDWHQDPTNAKWQTGEGHLIKRFAQEAKAYDRVLMRRGNEIIGVGEIPAGEEDQYEFNPAFRSVYGWDLRHQRRVKWAQDTGQNSLLKPFEQAYANAQQLPRFSEVRKAAAVAAAKDLDPAFLT